VPRARMSPEVKAALAAALTARPGAHVHGRASGRAADQLRRWIFDGVLRDGDVISQDDLAELLGVSRIPVRDAMIELDGAGWVVLEPGVGARAVGLDAAAVRDSFELFGTIWSLLARRAVERSADTAELVAAAGAVETASDADDMATANASFLAALRVAAAAPRLDAAFRSAARIVPGDFFAVVPDAIAVQRREVPRIAAAIRHADVGRAAELAMRLHRAHARSIGRLLARRGVFGGR
jgi:DNA-binding GntR family transcriptional regulator